MHVEWIPGADPEASPQRAWENNLTFGRNSRLHGKTILPYLVEFLKKCGERVVVPKGAASQLVEKHKIPGALGSRRVGGANLGSGYARTTSGSCTML